MPSGRLSEGEVNDLARTVFGDPASIGDNSLFAAPGVGWKIAVYGYQIVASGGANTVRFRSATNNISSGKSFAINGGISVPPGPIPLFECNENEALNVNLSAATAVAVDVQLAKVRV
jgi:glutamine cyclotransferase